MDFQNLELMKNTENQQAQKWKICTFFEKTRARFPRQKERWI